MSSTSSVESSTSSNRLLTVLGPTATGKTALACEVAYRLDGEIISADSRQVFRGMDIGTGKDLGDYDIHGSHIPYHIIDIHDPGYEYNVYQFQNDFLAAYAGITERGRLPIMCGGTGMYLESVLRGYRLPNAPVDERYRQSLEPCSDASLIERLAGYIKLHNHPDTETRDRLVRALEIQEFGEQNPDDYVHMPPMRHLVVGIALPREVVVGRIERRLRQRLDEGMIDEVNNLLEQGVPAERLLRYGLEYRHVTRYLKGECTYDELFTNLFTDIRRFSKRQMTWFRRMERNGVKIVWIDGQKNVESMADEVVELAKQTILSIPDAKNVASI